MADNDASAPRVDANQRVEINGVTYYPLVGPRLNPCAGKRDNTPCGPGCICLGGQCYYTTFQLQQMGVEIPM
ncbi:hypothetical protein [Sinorhizobium meliloti]|uniref:hypothetical protein n=1 Tax=Rhizobium meliloti TaxID=382 RepID=UPI000FD200CC|nr:hypothetical protein [Sinorhizobium meliloti]RVR13205.1 hypothetical protein CN243_01095 [Sinorhizobium meliloti]